MATLTAASTCRHAAFLLATSRPIEFIDLTDRLDRLVSDAGVRTGIVNVQTHHTTTAIVVNEHEPLLLTDFQALLERAVPDDGRYRHDDPAIRTVNLTPEERVNGHAHCRALMLAPSACLNINNGRLCLGRWQRVFLVELDGPREREVSAVVMGETGP
jgi:secondary thiamine-phosphate synthase enzyme